MSGRLTGRNALVIRERQGTQREMSEGARRLIVALDVPTLDEAWRYIQALEGIVGFFKIGLELFQVVNQAFIAELKQRGCRVFLDVKMSDVDETVRRAVRQAATMGVDFLTVHGPRATVRAAVSGKEGSSLAILAVPLLSSWDERTLQELGLLGPHSHCTPRFSRIEDYVTWRAEEAIDCGADGLIASGPFVKHLRSRFPDTLIVAPAIRPAGQNTHEHARSLTPAQAIRDGADYLVVGRPIRDASDRRAAAQQIVQEIEQALHAHR